MALKLITGGILVGVLLSESLDFVGGAKTETLKLVQVIFRHGDRAPTKFYPNDPYINDFDKLWPEGFAQLTNKGKMQQYELGKFLRHRYDGYLAKKYSQNELYVTSSDMDRTIMSLESNLAGLYPPIVNPWNPNLEWQPIPLRTIPRKEDKFLHNSAKCPKLSELRNNFYWRSDVARKTNKVHEDFIRYCAEHSGLEITTAKGLYPLLDILYAQASHNYTLPEWAQGDTLQKLLDIHGIVNTWPTYTDDMKRLSGGPFLHLLLRNMQAIAGHLGSHISHDEMIHSVHKGVNRKMLMYSAHDSTLARIMNTMGVFDPHCPPYASALMIELHKDQESRDYFIEFHYRNDTTRDPFVLTHPKCGYPCKLQTYLEITRPLIPINWKQECQQNFGTKSVSPAADPNFFTKHDVEDHDDGEDELLADKNNIGNILKSSSHPKSDNWFTPSSSCFPNSSQLLMLGFGLIISSILCAVVIIKLIQCRSGKYSLESYYVKSSGRKSFVEVLSRKSTPFYRSNYESL